MKSYQINVNGTVYDVTIEEVSPDAVKSAPAAASSAQPAPAVSATPATPAAPAANASAGRGENLSAPMPGTILEVKTRNGTLVKKGDVLFILEAMKMENEIFAPCDGVVSGLNIAAGTSVETGTALCFVG